MYDLILDSELALSGDSPNEHFRWTDMGFPVKGYIYAFINQQPLKISIHAWPLW